MDAIQQAAQEKISKRAKAKTDLLYLSTEILGYDFQEDPHSELFANYLQITPNTPLFEQDEVKDRLLLWPRGHFKTSSIVAQAVQLILNFPNIRILLMQGTVKNTKGLLREIKSHFNGENPKSKLPELFPEFCTDAKLGTELAFTVPARVQKHLKESTVTVASPKSVKAGQHYDAGFFDDLVHEQNYRNPDLIQKTVEDFNHYSPLIDPGGYKFVTGTRYAFGDLYEWIIRRNEVEDTDEDTEHSKKWKISIRECWYLKDGKRAPLFPQRKTADGRTIGFTIELLESLQKDDPETFSAQYLNKPISAGSQIFTEEMLLSRVVVGNEETLKTLNPTVLFIDLAGGQNKNADHAVILAGRTDHLNRMFVVDCIGDKFTPVQLGLMVLQMAFKHQPLKIMIEKTPSAEYFATYLRVIATQQGVRLPIDFIKVSNKKDAKAIRIASVEDELKNKRLFFFAGLPRWELLVEQFTRFQVAKASHDDYPDTVSLMVEFYRQNNPTRPVPSLLDHPFYSQEGNTLSDEAVFGDPASYGMSMGNDFV